MLKKPSVPIIFEWTLGWLSFSTVSNVCIWFEKYFAAFPKILHTCGFEMTYRIVVIDFVQKPTSIYITKSIRKTEAKQLMDLSDRRSIGKCCSSPLGDLQPSPLLHPNRGKPNELRKQHIKANPNPKMKWVSDERALAGVHFS